MDIKTKVQNNQIPPDASPSVSADTPSVLSNTVPVTATLADDVQVDLMPAVKPVVQESSISQIDSKLNVKKKSKVLSMGLWVISVLILVTIGVLGGVELYKRFHAIEEQQTEDVIANGEEQEEELPEKTMTIEEIRAVVNFDAMGDSLREIEDAAVDIDATFTIIDENLEESDDPPAL